MSALPSLGSLHDDPVVPDGRAAGEAPAVTVARLLAGPPLGDGPESLVAHRARVGPLPDLGGADFIEALSDSGLSGRGGAAFPTGTKWRAVAGRSHGNAVVVANGAEGEPASRKDRLLMATRPHLVLDGAVLAARATRAREVILFVNRTFSDGIAALRTACAERGGSDGVAIRLVEAPNLYVAGEETAAIRIIEGGRPLPQPVPPRPFESGVDGRPTLVQNVETLAHAALIARHGAAWFREVGTAQNPGSVLLSVTGVDGQVHVVEAAPGTAIGAITGQLGLDLASLRAVLLGGGFGGYVPGPIAAAAPLSDSALAALGASLGSGIVQVVRPDACGLAEGTRLVRYLAGQSAGQCGPCVRGLSSMAATLEQLVQGRQRWRGEVEKLRRWAGQVEGRGACHHPDGAIRVVLSIVATFGDEIERHARSGPCAI